MKTTLTPIVPIMGVPDGASSPDPAVKQAWLEQRRGGITATEIRDCGTGTKRRAIITGKVTGEEVNIDDVVVRSTGFTLGDYARHGKRREPVIAEWVERRFGITPCEHLYMHGQNPRYIASPDGVSRDPFSGELIVGTAEAILAEIKTATKDLHPGTLDENRVLVEIDESSTFAQKNYYTQMQWQMFVMNAAMTLFVWEQHDGKIDPETGTFTPIGTPQFAWVPRNQRLIDILVKQADKMLAEIDAARLANAAGELPPVSAIPSEQAILIADLLAARENEAVAKAAKEKAWAALNEFYMAEGAPDLTIKAPGFASVTVSTSTTMKPVADMDAARKRAPKLVAQYEALVKRYTKPEPVTTRKLTITKAN